MSVEDAKYNRIFVGNQDGVDILDELKARHVDQQSHTRGDTHETAYKEGQRAVVAWIIKKSEREGD